MSRIDDLCVRIRNERLNGCVDMKGVVVLRRNMAETGEQIRIKPSVAPAPRVMGGVEAQYWQ